MRLFEASWAAGVSGPLVQGIFVLHDGGDICGACVPAYRFPVAASPVASGE